MRRLATWRRHLIVFASAGLKFVFATNNSTRTPEQYMARLKGFGVVVEPWQVVTSSQGAAHAVAQKFPRGTKVFMIGEDGIQMALEERGFEVISVENAQQAEVVVMALIAALPFKKRVKLPCSCVEASLLCDESGQDFSHSSRRNPWRRRMDLRHYNRHGCSTYRCRQAIPIFDGPFPGKAWHKEGRDACCW